MAAIVKDSLLTLLLTNTSQEKKRERPRINVFIQTLQKNTELKSWVCSSSLKFLQRV